MNVQNYNVRGTFAMQQEEVFKILFDAVVEMNVQKGKDAATLLIQENHDPVEGIENGLSKGMKVIGEKFNKDGIPERPHRRSKGNRSERKIFSHDRRSPHFPKMG